MRSRVDSKIQRELKQNSYFGPKGRGRVNSSNIRVLKPNSSKLESPSLAAAMSKAVNHSSSVVHKVAKKAGRIEQLYKSSDNSSSLIGRSLKSRRKRSAGQRNNVGQLNEL